MKIKYAYTRLNVNDYFASRNFYQEVLGFKVLYADDMQEYAELDTGETKITILNRARLPEFINCSLRYDEHNAKLVLSFTVDDIEETITQMFL